MGGPEPRKPLAKHNSLNLICDYHYEAEKDPIVLLPAKNRFEAFSQQWKIGEKAALQRLHAFMEDGLHGYKEGRNFPNKNNVSRLSPHLHWGEISPNQVWFSVQSKIGESQLVNDVEHFLSELGWREFSYSLLFHNPSLTTDNLQNKFVTFLGVKMKNASENGKKA